MVADPEILDPLPPALGLDQRAAAVARRPVLDDIGAAAGIGVEMEELAGEILFRIELEIIAHAVLGHFEHIAREEIDTAVRVERQHRKERSGRHA